MEIYRFRMRTHFKNARKRLPTAIPEVLAKRAIFGKRKAEDGNGLPVIERGRMASGVKNYLPSYQDEKMPVLWMHTENNSMTSITSQVQRETKK